MEASKGKRKADGDDGKVYSKYQERPDMKTMRGLDVISQEQEKAKDKEYEQQKQLRALLKRYIRAGGNAVK